MIGANELPLEDRHLADCTDLQLKKDSQHAVR